MDEATLEQLAEETVTNFSNNFYTPSNVGGYQFVLIVGGNYFDRENLASSVRLKIGGQAFVHTSNEKVFDKKAYNLNLDSSNLREAV